MNCLEQIKYVIFCVILTYSQNFSRNSPHCLPYKSLDVSSENLIFDQLLI